MVKMRADTIEADALAWAAARAAGYHDVLITAYEDAGTPEECFFRPTKYDAQGNEVCGGGIRWKPHQSWQQGGPLLQRARIEVSPVGVDEDGGWTARDASNAVTTTGPTALVAAMRCLVKKAFGNEVDVPAVLVPVPAPAVMTKPRP